MIVFVIVALQPLITMSDQAGQMRIWALVVTAFFAGTALTMPQLLTLLSNLRLGLFPKKKPPPELIGFPRAMLAPLA